MHGGLHHKGRLACAGLPDDQERATLAEPAVIAQDGGRVILTLEGQQGVEVHALRAVSGLGALTLICQTCIVVEQCIRVGGVRSRVRCLTEEGGVGNEVDVLRAICRRTGKKISDC